MSDTVRWVIIIAAVLLVLGLVAFARGRVHQRGDDVGTSATSVVSVLAAGGRGG